MDIEQFEGIVEVDETCTKGEEHLSKKVKHIIGVALVIWFIFLITDFSLTIANKSPFFSVPVVMYKDGGSAEYYGLGYKVNKYVNLTAERGAEVIRVDFGTWFMSFKPPVK